MELGAAVVSVLGRQCVGSGTSRDLGPCGLFTDSASLEPLPVAEVQ